MRKVGKAYKFHTRLIGPLTMRLFANWGPPCRALTDNVSEWHLDCQ